jgi:hypothetical protein
VLSVLATASPAGSDLTSIDLGEGTDGAFTVTVVTATPRLWIGSRGSVADAIRARLSEALDDPRLALMIRERRSPPPPDSGVSEPRRPSPGAPSLGDEVEPPR